MNSKTKFIVITGWVISWVGKWVTSASIWKILKWYGYKVTSIKIDPYINIDAGTMRPTEHGEVWVTSDWWEIDQDLWNYERFLEISIPKKNNMTTGQIYKHVIDKERKGEYLWKTVQFIPHITWEIERRILNSAKWSEFAIIEVWGVVWDYENIPFLFAIKALEQKIWRENIVHILVSYLPVPSHTSEMKSKPTQQAIKALTEAAWIFSDFIVCRSPYLMDNIRKNKIVTYANIPLENVISTPDARTIYEIPLMLVREKLWEKLLKKFHLKKRKDFDYKTLEKLVNNILKPKKVIEIAIVWKYLHEWDNIMKDAYISVSESLVHVWANLNTKVNIRWVNSNEIEEFFKIKDWKEKISSDNHPLKWIDWIIVPGWFWTSWIEGKIEAIRYARENNIPYLWICLWMQLAIVEYARNVCGMKNAHSIEINPDTKYPVITILDSQKKILADSNLWGTMRLGIYAAILKPSKTQNFYKNSERYKNDKKQIKELKESKSEKFRLWIIKKGDFVILERHRHRYEVNPEYIEKLEKAWMLFVGYHERKDGTKLMEFIELPKHKFFHATQAHPEFISNISTPSPLFYNFVKASIK